MGTKKKKTKAKADAPVYDKGLVLYTDGGCRPGGRGIGGWGYHGYSYEMKPTKPTKKEDAITDHGYVNIALGDGDFDEEGYWSQPSRKDSTPQTVYSVANYYDGWGSVVPESTNNISELLAFKEALALTKELSPKKAMFWLDSEYVLKGVNDWHPKWEANNWISSAGKPVANAELWKEIIQDYRATCKDVELNLGWIKGHNDHLGNEMADRNATRGVILGKKGDQVSNQEVREVTDPRSYWNKKNPYNRLLAFPSWYFVVNQPSPQLLDGRTVYHIGAHGPKVSQCGKRVSNQGYAVVALKEPENALECLRDFQNTDCNHSYERVVVADLSKALLPDSYSDLNTYGHDYLARWTHLNDVYNEHEDRLTEELTTPLLVFRAVEQLSGLQDRLEKFISKDHNYALTDISDLLFQVETKGKKEVTILSKNIKQSEKAICVSAIRDTAEPESVIDLTLNIGFDLPNRNALNALAEFNPKITVLVEKETSRSFRYWTVIEVGDDIAIWSSIYANQKILLD